MGVEEPDPRQGASFICPFPCLARWPRLDVIVIGVWAGMTVSAYHFRV